MLIPSYKALFIHIPRTGGTSIEGYFRKEIIKKRPKEIYGKNCLQEYKKYHLNGRQHFPLKYFDRYDGIDDYFKFTFVRHPFDRLVSAYEYSFKKIYSFNFFIKVILRLPVLSNGFSASHITHLKPQHQFIGSNKLKLEFFGRFENLEADFRKIQIKMGLEPKKIPHTFKTKRKPYQDYFNKKTKSIAERVYRKDFKLFDYTP